MTLVQLTDHLITRLTVQPTAHLPSKPTELPTAHRWELLCNYPVFTVVMVIYHYLERIWIIIVTPNFSITYTMMNKYYPGEQVYIHIQPFKKIIKEKNWVITSKKG